MYPTRHPIASFGPFRVVISALMILVATAVANDPPEGNEPLVNELPRVDLFLTPENPDAEFPGEGVDNLIHPRGTQEVRVTIDKTGTVGNANFQLSGDLEVDARVDEAPNNILWSVADPIDEGEQIVQTLTITNTAPDEANATATVKCRWVRQGGGGGGGGALTGTASYEASLEDSVASWQFETDLTVYSAMNPTPETSRINFTVAFYDSACRILTATQITNINYTSHGDPGLAPAEFTQFDYHITQNLTPTTHEEAGSLGPEDLEVGARAVPVVEYNDGSPSDGPGDGDVAALPLEIVGHNRGTVNNPGGEVPAAEEEYGQVAVMLENADSENAPNSTEPDYSIEGDLSEYRMEHDDDFVQVVLRWPQGAVIEGARLELVPRGLIMDPREEEDEQRYGENATHSLNFYSPDGTRLEPEDLVIEDLQNPGDGYLAEIFDTGELTLFIEGAVQFGLVAPYLQPREGEHPAASLAQARDSAQQVGGAMLNFEFTYENIEARVRLLVYCGGYLHFRMPETETPLPAGGVLGVLEFRDGIGRLSANQTDEGNVIHAWAARSGTTGGLHYEDVDMNGHVPPGWYLSYERLDFWGGGQLDHPHGQGNPQPTRQGSYRRWMQDDEVDPDDRYTQDFIYDPSLPHDANIGPPEGIHFKWQMESIPPHATARTQIQIHPDGRRTGTAGCVGLQYYQDCLDLSQVLSSYHQLKILVELE